ncbi:MAG: PP2C family protein-serine/threonine phosphatase [Candidatus Rifleibacteriota bacterium]
MKDLLLKISIRNTVISLLLMANAIPAIVLIIVSIDNYAQTKRTMLKQKHAEQISYMQSIEENLVFEHSRLLNNCLSATRYLEKSLSEHVLNHTMVVELKNRLGQDCNEFYIVASSANLIGSNIGFFDGKKFLTVDEKKSINDFKQTIDAMKGVGYLFLVLWNKIAANDPRKIAETEIIIESLFQAPVHEVFQSFLGFHDNLSIYNWGSEKKPVYLTTVYGKDRSLANYLLIAFFDPNRQVLNFIRKHSSNVRRNLMGSQLFFGHPRKKNSDRQAFGLPEKLYPLVFKAQTYPTFEPEIVSIDSEEFVFSGVTCKYPFRQHLIALYPLNLLEKKLNGNLKEMILVTILAIILVLSISGLFLHGIIIPLRALNQGAVAMQAKNFSYRLPDMGTDELGEMAGIFNRNMEDLEEMQAAGIVQNSIMPTTCFERDTYSLYGKSIVLAGLGGDYFDYFEVKDEQKTTCSIMMGDVAGHGVGAALLMTMAKTAVQFFQNFSREPVQMVQSLHKLIHSTRTKKQKKIMTFQFLSLDSSTLSARYSNAGACSPILVNPSKNMAREISLAGPALGAFKKSEFKEIELKLEPGDALILYTDGIAEAKSSAGKTLGYDRLAQLLLQCWSGNAESYYQNIVRAYENWLDGAPPEDDLTIIVLVIK